MRTWLLLALLGLVLFISMRYREGADSTLAPAPTCPPDTTSQGDGRCVKLTGVSPDSNNKCRTGWDDEGEFGGPYGFPPDLKQFDQKCIKYIQATCPSGYLVDASAGLKCIPDPHMPPSSSPITPTTSSVDPCNNYWDAAIVSWASGSAAFPAQAATECKQHAPSWIMALDATGNLLDSSGQPTAATRAQAIIEQKQATDYATETSTTKAYAASTGYADILKSINDTDNGALPAAIDETNRKMDIEASRSTTGPVFESDGVFSGQSGTGQGTASSAAAGLAGGNQYGGTAGGTYDSNGNVPGSGAYGMWQGTKGTSTPPPGNNLPVNGPSWGGRGTLSGSSSSSMSSRPAPTLYGPQAGKTGPGSGLQSGYPQTNSENGQFGSSCTTGSDPNNAFAATSRCPGDQDLIPNPYLQSTSYSLANGSQKTNPVPFLSDFSAFQR